MKNQAETGAVTGFVVSKDVRGTEGGAYLEFIEKGRRAWVEFDLEADARGAGRA